MYGYKPLKLVSVRLQLNGKWQNYEIYYQVLYCIELMTKNEKIWKEEDKISTKKHVLISKGLLCFDISIPEYVRNCWLLFINNTKTLNIDYYYDLFDKYPKYIV